MGTYRDRNEALLIRFLPNDVARLAVAAVQNVPSIRSATGGRATNLGRCIPDHLRVMTDQWVSWAPIITDQLAVIIILFGDPALLHLGHRYRSRVSAPCKVLTLVTG